MVQRFGLHLPYIRLDKRICLCGLHGNANAPRVFGLPKLVEFVWKLPVPVSNKKPGIRNKGGSVFGTHNLTAGAVLYNGEQRFAVQGVDVFNPLLVEGIWETLTLPKKQAE